MINGHRTPSETEHLNRREAFKREYGEGMWFGIRFPDTKNEHKAKEKIVEAEFQILDHKVKKGR